MNPVLTVAAHEFKMMYRRRIFQLLTVGPPLVALVALVVVWAVQNVSEDEDEDEKTQVAYVDSTGLFTGHLTQNDLEFAAYPSLDDGKRALLSEDVKRLYVIPSDYLMTGVVQRIEVSTGLGFDGGGREHALRAFLLDNLSESAPESEVIERLKEPLVLTSIAVDPEGLPRDYNETRIFFFFGLALLLMVSLAMTGGFMLQGMGEEKENRVMEVLLSSVAAGQFMMGKILGLSAAGLSQILVWVALGRVLLEVLPSVLPDVELTLPGIAPTLLAVAFFVLGYLLFATLNAGLGALLPTMRESQQLSIFVAAPLIVPIYAWLYIVENPTAAVVQFLTYFPFTAPLVVLQRLGPEAIEWWEVAASLVILALTVVVAVFLVGRVFRAFLLSYGKRPGLRTLWGALARG